MEQEKVEDKYFTVSEIAKKVGITRNKCWAYIRKNNIKPVKKTEKVYYYDSETVFKIKKKYQKKQIKNKVKNDSSIVSDSVLAILKKELDDKQKTIEAQQDQIKKQQETIDYFKSENVALRLESSKKQKLLEESEKKKDAISENDVEKKKQGFWSRLFDRN